MARSRSPEPRRRSRSRSPSPRRRYSRSRSRSPVRQTRDEGTNLYLSGLSSRIENRDLTELFSKEGEVMEARIVLDPRTKESRGFGFVNMATSEDARRALKHLNGKTVSGRVLMIEFAKRERARTPTPGQYKGVRSEPSNYDDRSRYDDRRDDRRERRTPPRRYRSRSPDYSSYRGGR
mmetsp:Transcript_13659/g.18727  ORF Transcript_13659/g.18727 Transcript_13659/m.18727 type:complete len:178 (-) Transcript_13659:219-752(-)